MVRIGLEVLGELWRVRFGLVKVEIWVLVRGWFGLEIGVIL